MNPFKVGDTVEILDVAGSTLAVGSIHTVLRITGKYIEIKDISEKYVTSCFLKDELKYIPPNTKRRIRIR